MPTIQVDTFRFITDHGRFSCFQLQYRLNKQTSQPCHCQIFSLLERVDWEMSINIDEASLQKLVHMAYNYLFNLSASRDRC